MTKTQEIKQAQKHLEAAQAEIKRIETAQQQAQDGISHANCQINQLEGQLPALATKAALADADPADFYKSLEEKSAMKREKAFHEASFHGLEVMLEQSKEAMKQAETDLRKKQNWQRFEELKSQLLEKYDYDAQYEAKRMAHNVGNSSEAVRSYGVLVKELRKLNRHINIEY